MASPNLMEEPFSAESVDRAGVPIARSEPCEMNVLLYEPGEEERVISLPSERQADAESLRLEDMQHIVGGYIEALTLNGPDETYLLVLNEESRLHKLKPNLKVRIGGRDMTILGTCFVCKKAESNMVGLSDEDVTTVKMLMGEWVIRA
jgi:hypothetical protein